MPSLVLLAAAVAAASPQGEPARLLNGNQMIGATDYPLESVRNDEEGTVEVKLKVAPSGTAVACSVTQTSGHKALDEQTCRLLQRRARFEPARNRKGKAVESEVSQRIVWRLADGPEEKMPRGEWMMRLIFGLSAEGAAVSCKVETRGLPSSMALCAVGGLGPAKDGPEPSVDGYGIVQVDFYPVDPDTAPNPPELEDAQRIARQISRVSIDPDGKVIACEGIFYSGDSSPANDQCVRAEEIRFEQLPEGAGPVIGTVVQTMYVRRPPRKP